MARVYILSLAPSVAILHGNVCVQAAGAGDLLHAVALTHRHASHHGCHDAVIFLICEKKHRRVKNLLSPGHRTRLVHDKEGMRHSGEVLRRGEHATWAFPVLAAKHVLQHLGVPPNVAPLVELAIWIHDGKAELPRALAGLTYQQGPEGVCGTVVLLY